jgi:glycosyltransferase involved in cell wall biosynthesis
MRLLIAVNKRLPESDYRIAFARLSRVVDEVRYALPGRPQGVPEARFLTMGMGEGVALADVAHFVRLYRTLRGLRRELDLVHFYSTKLLLLGPLVARLAGVESIITVTGFGRVFGSKALRHRCLRPLYLALLRLAAWLTRAVLFQSHGDQEFFVRRVPWAAERCHYVGSGMSTPIFSTKDYGERPLVVALVARLAESKGIDDFLSLAEELRGGAFAFRLIGPPSVGQNALVKRVEAAARQGVIAYTGELSTSETEGELRRAHVFFFPSRVEGVARVMLEAGLCGACPIAYDIAANRDLVAPGRGFLVPLGDVARARAALEELERDRRRLADHAAAYRAFVAEHFSAAAFARRLDRVLEALRETSPARERHASG